MPSQTEPANLSKSFQHVGRTLLASVGAILIAGLFSLPESYWAGIIALIVMQSTLKTVWELSVRQLIGTAFGATAAAVLYQTLGPTALSFAVGILFLGVVAILAGTLNRSLPGNMDRTAYRFAGIALIVVLLIPRQEAVWFAARDRFCEVAIGIVAALLAELVWPDPDAKAEDKRT